MIDLLIPYTMGVLSAWSGGSLWPSQYLPKKLTWLPEAAFACFFGYALWPLIGAWSLLAVIWSYAWMQSATAPGLHWGDPEHYNPEKTSTLKPLVDWLSPWHSSTVQYCRVYMAVKGFLIGLPVGGIPLAILWPLGYEIGNRVKNHTVSEAASGFFAGIVVCIFRTIIPILTV